LEVRIWKFCPLNEHLGIWKFCPLNEHLEI